MHLFLFTPDEKSEKYKSQRQESILQIKKKQRHLLKLKSNHSPVNRVGITQLGAECHLLSVLSQRGWLTAESSAARITPSLAMAAQALLCLSAFHFSHFQIAFCSCLFFFFLLFLHFHYSYSNNTAVLYSYVTIHREFAYESIRPPFICCRH